MANAIQMFIDEPADAVIDKIEFTLSGWVAFQPGYRPAISFSTLCNQLPTEWVERPDVKLSITDREVRGFRLDIRVADQLRALENEYLLIFVCCNRHVSGCFRLRLGHGIVNASVHNGLTA